VLAATPLTLDDTAAAHLLEEALSFYERKGIVPLIERTRARLSEIPCQPRPRPHSRCGDTGRLRVREMHLR
jgi:hypothetical protein